MSTNTYQPYLTLPIFVTADQRISNSAKHLLALLENYRNKATGQCNPRVRRLASDLGLTERTIYRALAELRKWQLITVKRMRNTCQYIIRARNEWYNLLRKTISDTVEKVLPPQPAVEPVPVPETPAMMPTLDCQECQVRPDIDVRSEPPHLLLNLPSEPPYPANEGIDAARSVHHVETTQAAAAPPALVDNGRSKTRSPLSEELWKELVAVHPQPGKPIAALEEIDRLLFDNRGQAVKLAAVLRTRHAEWRVYWATLDRAGYIPQLWRWVKECEWIAAPVIRKPALRAYATAGERNKAMMERLAEKDRLRGLA
jgi:DNA-binding transcriptional ArsR family regulator